MKASLQTIRPRAITSMPRFILEQSTVFVFAIYCIFLLTNQAYGIDPRKIIDRERMTHPILPSDFDELIAKAYEANLYLKPADKLIPRNLWIAFREIPPPNKMYPHMKKIVDGAEKSGWRSLYMNQTSESDFIHSFYHDTSVSWAYDIIHPHYELCNVDIWKYAALYAFGGLYIDDDASFRTPIENIVYPNDTAILGDSGRTYRECYIDNNPLSIKWQRTLWNVQDAITVFQNNDISSWAMFFQPRDPLILRVLKNLVEVVKREYLRKSALLADRRYNRRIECFTGASLLSASLRAVFIPQEKFHSTNYSIRVTEFNFMEYGGVYTVHKFKPYQSRPLPQERKVGTFLQRYLY